MANPDNYKIRAAKAADIPTLGRLLRASFITTMSPIVPEAANIAFNGLKEPERFVDSCWQDFKVITTPDGVKGMLFVVEDKIESIHLEPTQKRKGFGSLLLKKGEEQIFHKGYSTAKLDVLTGNIDAIAFYAAQGWDIDHKFTGLEIGDVPVAMFQMTKNLRHIES